MYFAGMSSYDVLIIGGGPIGIACGIAAKKAGLNYIIIEKGCIVNSLYNYPVHMTFFSTPERLEIGDVPFMSLYNKPNRQEAVEYYRRVVQLYHINMRLFEKVVKVENSDTNQFFVHTTRDTYNTKNIVAATGFHDVPNLLNIPGEELSKVTHYYKDPHYYASQKVAVIGANNSAVDAALETWRKGAQVTMIIRDEEIGERVKYWVRPDIINRIAEGSIKAYINSIVTAIRLNEIDILTPTGSITIENDFVIATTGYMPDFALLESMGVELSKDEKRYPVYNSETMQTNVCGIYLAGVVCGGMDTHKWFIENSREHAEKVINNIVSLNK